MSTYDDVHREAMADRRNDGIPDERPDPAEYAGLAPLSGRQFGPPAPGQYEPGPDDPF